MPPSVTWRVRQAQLVSAPQRLDDCAFTPIDAGGDDVGPELDDAAAFL